jgi:transcription elongation GreA/GreB family factor
LSPLPLPSKPAVVAALLAGLERDLTAMKEAAEAAHAAATHEEARPENDKDTRAIEAGYLAGAQAARVKELEGTAAGLKFLTLRPFGPEDGVDVGALVETESESGRAVFLVAPVGGGLRAVVGGVEVQVVTPRSPLGAALAGKSAGDALEVVVKGSTRDYEIVRVV